MTASTETETAARPLPANLADVALIDAATCTAAGGMSVSWWHAEVAAGRAPQPVIRKPRCTRWKLSDVRAFWTAFAEQGPTGSDKLMAITKKASAAAKAKRAQLAKVEA